MKRNDSLGFCLLFTNFLWQIVGRKKERGAYESRDMLQTRRRGVRLIGDQEVVNDVGKREKGNGSGGSSTFGAKKLLAKGAPRESDKKDNK
jgi:hypothetical protein